MLTELVNQARRRVWWNELLAQGAWALSVGMAALVLLLLLGTEILDWYWLVLLPVLTFGLGIWRTVRQLPSSYTVAQMIDNRLGLVDTLSTALYFDRTPASVPAGTRNLQRAFAERLCGKVVVRQAIPFTMPRAVYAFSALLLTASSLFALRYAVERRLSLQKPVARILQQALGFDRQEAAAAEQKKKPVQKRSPLDEMAGLSLPASDQPAPGDAQRSEAALDASGKTQVEGEKSLAKDGMQKSSSSGAESGEEAGETTDEAGSATDPNGSDGQQSAPSPSQAGSQADKGTPSGSPGNNSSLMAKFKDAMQNLLSRMKPPSGGSAANQAQSAQNQNGQQGNPQPGGNSQGGKQGKQSSGQEGESQDGQSGQDAQMARNAQGRGAGKNGEEQGSNQPGSGIGKQDGNKDPKLAEQLAAMGKLSEIIGKRSANVSGEVTVEVQSNSQQLQTPYAHRNAIHGESNTEISRDEVPVALQAYVQQYFEHVRRQAPVTRAKN